MIVNSRDRKNCRNLVSKAASPADLAFMEVFPFSCLLVDFRKLFSLLLKLKVETAMMKT